MELVERLKASTERRKAEAGAMYKALLVKPELSDDEELQLLDCLQILGRKVEDVPADAALLAQANGYKDAIEGASGLMVAERENAVKRRKIEADCEQIRQQAITDRDAALQTLAREYSSTAMKLSAARSATQAISGLWSRLDAVFGSADEWRVRFPS